MSTQRSLILITVDCLRLDRCTAEGSTVTPALRQIARESTVFPCALVGGAPTYYSFPAILGGRHPLALGRDVLGLAPGEPTLASVLREQGYLTAAFVAGNAYLTARFGYHQGFDQFEDFLVGTTAPEGEAEAPGGGTAGQLNEALRSVAAAAGLGRWYNEAYFRYGLWRARQQPATMDQLRCYPSADKMVEQVGPWLAGRAGEPFFLWIHLMDPHHPYYPPAEALQAIGRGDLDARRAREVNSVWNRGDLPARELEKWRRDAVALYDAGVYWADRQIGRIREQLEMLGLADDTVLAVTADHGEELLEHGRRYHRPDALPETLIRVPLLVHVPGETPLPQATAPFSQVDLPATLLQAIGCDAAGMPGHPRWNELLEGSGEPGLAITECVAGSANPFHHARRDGDRLLAVHDGRYKLVWHMEQGREELYDLAADPQERAPLAADEARPVRARLLQAALEHVRRSREGRNQPLRLRARLRDLRLEGTAAFR